ncbi:MAG: hypothetical protein LBG48_04960, partial [Rickettsiales bacterium]|nr:hypothetical protein [Rickettsiales bacterium]
MFVKHYSRFSIALKSNCNCPPNNLLKLFSYFAKSPSESSARTILCWIKNANNLLEQENQRRKEEIPKTGEKTIIPIIEMDELFTYIKKKPKNSEGKKYNDKRVWLAVDRNRNEVIAFEVGNEQITNAYKMTYEILYGHSSDHVINNEQLNTIINYFCTDGHHAYDKVYNTYKNNI